jgi:hypothetical protein
MSLSPLSCVVDSPRVVSCSETVVEAFCLCVLNSFPAGDIGLWLVMIIARLPELAAWHVIVTDKKCEIKYLSVSSSTLLSVHRQTDSDTLLRSVEQVHGARYNSTQKRGERV